MRPVRVSALWLVPLVAFGFSYGQSDASEPKLQVLIIGAHPDDADRMAGGTAAKYAEAGHQVRLVSMTNGDAGHPEISGPPLAQRRREEARKAGAVIGAKYLVLDHHDGELVPSLDVRREVIRLIRQFGADVVITHRTNAGHPDHRYTGVLVLDAIQQVVVAPIVPDVPALDELPVLLYMSDRHTKPNPFEADIVVSVDDAMEKKIDMVNCHVSQVYESNILNLPDVPEDAGARRALLAELLQGWFGWAAEHDRASLVRVYGDEAGAGVLYAEAFELSEYGRQIPEDGYRDVVPF
jgi:N-acetylglucosamine malate deacetylase 1